MRYCLVVDDSHAIRTVARHIFEELGFAVGEAENGMSALRACREKTPDLIFLDWSMPGLSGIELVRGLRAQPDGHRFRLLVSVTEMDAGEISHAVAAGIDDYVLKPFDHTVLATKLAELDVLGDDDRRRA